MVSDLYFLLRSSANNKLAVNKASDRLVCPLIWVVSEMTIVVSIGKIDLQLILILAKVLFLHSGQLLPGKVPENPDQFY